MTRILVVTYSQTGQLSLVTNAFVQPLIDNASTEVVFEYISPEKDYPFPWPFIRFFTIFPEAVMMKAPAMKPFASHTNEDFDLVILAYQVWFLSPSLPMTGFLKSEFAGQVLRDTPVITLIACRDMWLSAQEKVKRELVRLNANLIDNVVLVDECGSAMSFLATPIWMFTGKKGPWPLVPKAGVSENDIKECKRFGERIVVQIKRLNGKPIARPLLKGLGAVTVKEKTIASELVAHRSFKVWSRILRVMGSQDSISRYIAVHFYIGYLVVLILTLAPTAALLKIIISPFTKNRIAAQKHYYSKPSGEGRYNVSCPATQRDD